LASATFATEWLEARVCLQTGGAVVIRSAVSSILIADRDFSVREVLADVTRDHFPESSIHLARSREEVLEIVPKLHQPSAAVLHWGLSEDLGECVRQLRSAGVPILLISAWDLPRVVAATGPTEASLQKPFDLGDYVAAIRRLLERRTASDALA
jgi:DNA-binding response OmpR family regulator